MEEELKSVTNKYARVKIIRKYKSRVYINRDDCVILFDKRYDIGLGEYVSECFTKTVCHTCNTDCQFQEIIGNILCNNVEYQQCVYCYYKNIKVCSECYMPNKMCTKAKVTIILILRQHLHRDIIPLILHKIHS
jgi:hypothetical protein